MPFDALTGPELTARLTWLWNSRTRLTPAEWNEYYVRIVKDIFEHYPFGELGGLLEHFDHDVLCHECFQEKVWAADYTDQRDQTYRAFYRRMFRNFLIDLYRRHQEEFRVTEPLPEGQDLAELEDEEGSAGNLSGIEPEAPPTHLLDAIFVAHLVTAVRDFLTGLDEVDRLLLKCWFAKDGPVPLVRFKRIVGSRYNSRAVRLGIIHQTCDATYSDYEDTLIGGLWKRVCRTWIENHPGRYVPEDGITELVSIVKREALELKDPDCRAVLGDDETGDHSERVS